MQYDRPITLSIAGFDPTGGAGILADIKTIEQHQCLGFGVITANTIQTESEVLEVEWIATETIMQQTSVLLDNYTVSSVKIGIVSSLQTLKMLCELIREKQISAEIVWDPVLKATSGKMFMDSKSETELNECLNLIDVITPNAEEVMALATINDPFKAAEKLAEKTAVLLKGGHLSEERGKDFLYHKSSRMVFEPSTETYFDKHGTGCILSSAIAANIALGISLHEACQLAKNYVAKRALTNKNKLAYHA